MNEGNLFYIVSISRMTAYISLAALSVYAITRHKESMDPAGSNEKEPADMSDNSSPVISDLKGLITGSTNFIAAISKGVKTCGSKQKNRSEYPD